MDIIKKQVEEMRNNQNFILEAVKYLDEKIKEVIDKTNDKASVDVKDMIESQAMIDEIIVKTSDDILILKKTKEENSNTIKALDTKINLISQEIKLTEEKIVDKVTKEEKPISLKCNSCDKVFNRSVDLERHIKEEHDNHETFNCDQCEKTFVLKWRLKKHARIHTKEFVQFCHYFNNGRKCPYEELGCKFLHVVSEMCSYGQKCQKRLCPQRHSEEKRKTDDDNNDTDNSLDEENEEENDSSSSFVTSTPQKAIFQCEECEKNEECTDCFVRQYLETSSKKRKVHFMSHSRETC